MRLIFVFLSILLADQKTDFEKEAKMIVAELKKSFMSELGHGLKKGPIHALDSCHLKAPHLVEGDFSLKYEVGRTALKIRNQKNSPQNWMQEALKQYQDSTGDKPMAGQVISVETKLAYVEPIYIKTTCLQCHGDISAKLQNQITKKYPQDQATGYKLNQLRGIFWVKQK